MTEKEAWGQAFENGRKKGDAEGYARGKAETVKHGRWEWCGEDRFNDAYRCSECGRIAMNDPNYCPNCGARMDGDVDGSRKAN